MTSTRGDTDAGRPGRVAPGDRSVVPRVAGVRWWVGLLLALALTVAGAAVDVHRTGTLGVAFLVGFPVGCVLATAAARRSELFVPMVQPPLLVAVTVPSVVAATGALPASGGTVSTVLAIAGPMIDGFPAMAMTTAVCLALGCARIALQPWRAGPLRDRPAPPRHRPERRTDERRTDERRTDERRTDEHPPASRTREPRRDPRAGAEPGRPASVDERPTRRSPPVAPSDDDPRRRPREERMRTDRMRSERRREEQRRADRRQEDWRARERPPGGR